MQGTANLKANEKRGQSCGNKGLLSTMNHAKKKKTNNGVGLEQLIPGLLCPWHCLCYAHFESVSMNLKLNGSSVYWLEVAISNTKYLYQYATAHTTNHHTHFTVYCCGINMDGLSHHTPFSGHTVYIYTASTKTSKNIENIKNKKSSINK